MVVERPGGRQLHDNARVWSNWSTGMPVRKEGVIGVGSRA